MNAKQALNILYQAAGMAALQREAHEQVNKAGQVLAELVKDIPDEPEAPEPEKEGELD